MSDQIIQTLLAAVVFTAGFVFVLALPKTRAGKTNISYYALFAFLVGIGVAVKMLNPALPWGPAIALAMAASTLSTIAFWQFIIS